MLDLWNFIKLINYINSTQTIPNKSSNNIQQEIQIFLDAAVWISFIKQPNTRRHWAPGTSVSQVPEFVEIKRFSHSGNKSLDKITPLLERMRKACLKIPLEKDL